MARRSKESKQPKVMCHVIKADIKKSDKSEQVEDSGMSQWLEPAYDLRGLKNMVNHSSILPQCIRAYRNNIVGYGIGVRYKDNQTDDDKEALEEFNKAEEIVELFNLDMDTKEVFEDIVEARETYGIAYLEVIRNIKNEVVGIEFVKDPNTIRKTAQLEPYVEVSFIHNGKTETRPKKFCKYKQTGGVSKTVYFKEIGDPRIMDKRTGDYLEKGKKLDIMYQANEIMEFPLGTAAYGEVRWVGQILGVSGSRSAEELNNAYFSEGRHTPLMILIKGGTLTDDSFAKMKEYMNDIKGKEGQHAFMVLEAESTEPRTALEPENKPDIQVVPLANVLQRDELFQDYHDNNRRRVQSAFLLPDLYVGYSRDFNRATAQCAMEITEKQVFQPERKSLAWAINNKLLADYGFRHVEVYLKEPEITNPDDIVKMFSLAERAGALTPNKAKEIAYKIIGEDSDDFEGDWAKEPLAYTKIKKEEEHIERSDNEIVAVLKEIRKTLYTEKNAPNRCKHLTNMNENGIIKADEEVEVNGVLGRWRTMNGARVHVASADGKINAGCGGKFNGLTIEEASTSVEVNGRVCKEIKLGNDTLYVSYNDSTIQGGCGERYNGMTLKQANEVASFTPRDYIRNKEDLTVDHAIASKPMSDRKQWKNWDSERNHRDLYPDLTKEQYVARAQALASCAIGGNIEGYKATSCTGRYVENNGTVVKFNRQTGDWVRVWETGVATMFRPTEFGDTPDGWLRYYEYYKEIETRRR